MTNEDLLNKVNASYDAWEEDGDLLTLREAEENALALIQSFREEIERETVEKCLTALKEKRQKLYDKSCKYESGTPQYWDAYNAYVCFEQAQEIIRPFIPTKTT